MASTGDFALTNIGLDYPNQIAPIKKLNPHAPAHTFFDTSSFASDLSCGYEVCGVTGSAKQFLFHGPGTINTDAGVEKDTKLTERSNSTCASSFSTSSTTPTSSPALRWAMRTAASSARSPTPHPLVLVRSAVSSSSNLNRATGGLRNKPEAARSFDERIFLMKMARLTCFAFAALTVNLALRKRLLPPKSICLYWERRRDTGTSPSPMPWQ